MAEPALVLFDEQISRDWQPFTLTRPAGELLFGVLTLRERAERVFSFPCLGYITEPHLRPFDEPGAPPVLDAANLPHQGELLFLSSRAVAAWDSTIPRGSSRLLAMGGQICGWYAAAGEPHPPPDFFLAPDRTAPRELPVVELEGRLLARVWELVTENAEQIGRDVAALAPAGATDLPQGCYRLGSGRVVLGQKTHVEPGVVLDTREGPVWLDDGAAIRSFTRLAGPAYVGRQTMVLGGSCAALSLGPVCRVRGEVEESVILGYSNKAHDGFLGHAYLGRWVNLGALTTNSDLKNNYGTIRIWTPAGEVDSGRIKLGCLLGDHVKTAIGTMLNTGTVVGAGSNLFGPAMPPKYVPPFSWGGGEELREYELEKFLATAETVMRRRKLEMTAAQRGLLRGAWRRGRGWE